MSNARDPLVIAWECSDAWRELALKALGLRLEDIPPHHRKYETTMRAYARTTLDERSVDYMQRIRRTLEAADDETTLQAAERVATLAAEARQQADALFADINDRTTDLTQ